MAVSLKPTTLEEFVKYAELPENADRTLEWITRTFTFWLPPMS